MSTDDIKFAVDSVVSAALLNAKFTNSTDELLKQLPIQEDPELLLKKKEAESLEKKIELEELKKQVEEDSIEFAKEQLKKLVTQFVPIPKLPVIDPKIIQAALLAKKIKDQKKEKQKNVKANAKKAKEIYTYPMKSRKNLITQMPELPKLPELPDLPNLPELPNVPNIPNL